MEDPGTNGGNPYSREKLHQDMDLFFHVMDDYNYYPSSDSAFRHKPQPCNKYGEYTEDWMKNMQRIDDIAGSYMNVIPTFVKRAIGLCIPVCPEIVQSIGGSRNLCAKYDNLMFGTIKDLLNEHVSGFGDIMTNYNNYPIGNNRLKYNFKGCKKLIEGGIRFANAFVVQNDGAHHDLFMVGKDRPPLDATCDLQYHSRWHWRAAGVMRSFLEMTQIARGGKATGHKGPTVPYRGQGTH